MDPGRLRQELEAEAKSAGLDAIAVARADVLDRDRARLEQWIARGQQSGMTWMARDPARRADPRALLEGCRSVVALALNYWPGEEQARTPEGQARVALYARGRDYHKVLGRKAKRLACWIDTNAAGATSLAFVDTGPVLERAWAERAGLGWIGKNSNLIRRDSGSWLLLAEVLTTADVAPDAGPHADFCGSCTACLDACPTQAIVAPGVVDSNACISYWTIEHRGAIPEPQRAGIGDWIFGCDVCQEVCPWNASFAHPAAGDPLGGRPDLAGLDPSMILELDEAAFRARYSGTSLMRAKWEGMRRNACVVLGNQGDPRALPALERAAADADPVVRSHARWAMRAIQDRAERGVRR